VGRCWFNVDERGGNLAVIEKRGLATLTAFPNTNLMQTGEAKAFPLSVC
jgi:hypothetical protein